jgi:hypothetical protein
MALETQTPAGRRECPHACYGKALSGQRSVTKGSSPRIGNVDLKLRFRVRHRGTYTRELELFSGLRHERRGMLYLL